VGRPEKAALNAAYKDAVALLGPWAEAMREADQDRRWQLQRRLYLMRESYRTRTKANDTSRELAQKLGRPRSARPEEAGVFKKLSEAFENTALGKEYIERLKMAGDVLKWCDRSGVLTSDLVKQLRGHIAVIFRFMNANRELFKFVRELGEVTEHLGEVAQLLDLLEKAIFDRDQFHWDNLAMLGVKTIAGQLGPAGKAGVMLGEATVCVRKYINNDDCQRIVANADAEARSNLIRLQSLIDAEDGALQRLKQYIRLLEHRILNYRSEKVTPTKVESLHIKGMQVIEDFLDGIGRGDRPNWAGGDGPRPSSTLPNPAALAVHGLDFAFRPADARAGLRA
jgi:hypothetical protein